MRNIPWRLLAAAAFTAALLDLPFPLAGPLPVWRTLFAWFALVPLLVAVLRLPHAFIGHRGRWYLGWSFLAGWLSGALSFGANCYWVYDTMHIYGGLNPPLAVITLVLFSLFLGFWFGVFALALSLIQLVSIEKKTACLPLAAVPILWTAMEFSLARIPEFPWDQLGYSQVDNQLLTQIAPWAGVYGITFVLALVNSLFAAALVLERTQVRVSARVYCGSLGLLLFAIGASGIFLNPSRPLASATAVLVQPNLDVIQDDVWGVPEWDRHMAEFSRLGGQGCNVSYIAGLPETGAAHGIIPCGPNPAPPDLIVWPESPAPFQERDPRFQAAMASITAADKAPLIVGNIGMDYNEADQQYQIYNSASVVTLAGDFAGRYDKIHLVPFGEYIPFRRLLFFAQKLTRNLSDLAIGTNRKTFRINAESGAHRYGIFICYESVFGDEIRQFSRMGAEVLVNISDDGWYGDTSAPWQHLNMARMRAIENRRWILRDTNNGVTASIDPYGTIRSSIPRHQVGSLAATFGYSSELTFYTVHGDWLPALCAILALALLVWSTRVSLREISAKNPSRRAQLRS